jgi:transposase
MVRPHSDMQKIREVLRLTFAGVTWPLHEGFDTAGLERKLFRQPERLPGQHPVPDWNYVRKELTKTGVTKWLLWEEYREQHPGGYAYSQFCNLYREWSKSDDVVIRGHVPPGGGDLRS